MKEYCTRKESCSFAIRATIPLSEDGKIFYLPLPDDKETFSVAELNNILHEFLEERERTDDR